MTRARTAAALLALCLTVAGGAAWAQKSAPKENLVIGISQYPATLHPMYDSMAAKTYVLGAALRPVTAYDADGLPVCILCTEMPSRENGRIVTETYDGPQGPQTGLAITYTLDDALFWNDGTPLTAKDVLFAWEVGRHPDSGVSNAALFTKDIRAVTVRDARTFTLHTDKPRCHAESIGDFYPLPAHVEGPVFEKDPAGYMKNTLYHTAPATAGLYAGPYALRAALAGDRVTLARNPHWKKRPPPFDTVTFRAIENATALGANLLAGDIDYIAGELGLQLDEALAFEKRLNAARPGQYNALYAAGRVYEHIDLPLDRPVFADVRLRRALLLAIDRDGINRNLFGGRQPVAASSISPQDALWHPDLAPLPHDPAAAAALLDAAGWRTGPQGGTRQNAQGEKLRVTLTTTAGDKTRETVAQAIQSAWHALGVETVIRPLPARVLFGDVMRKRSFDGGAMYAWISAPQSVPRTTLHSAMIPSADNNYAGQNYPAYADAEMDGIIEALETVCQPAENAALWRRLQEKYAETLPALPLFFRVNPFFIPAWLDGVRPTGHMHPTTLWIETWGLK